LSVVSFNTTIIKYQFARNAKYFICAIKTIPTVWSGNGLIAFSKECCISSRYSGISQRIHQLAMAYTIYLLELSIR